MEKLSHLMETYALGLGIYLLVAGAIGLFFGLRQGYAIRGLWFGALLGPLGWFLISRWEPRGVPCAECGGVNARGRRICRYCGINMRTAAKRSSRSRARGVSDGWR